MNEISTPTIRGEHLKKVSPEKNKYENFKYFHTLRGIE